MKMKMKSVRQLFVGDTIRTSLGEGLSSEGLQLSYLVTERQETRRGWSQRIPIRTV